MDLQLILRYTSMVIIIITGIVFLYIGSKYIFIKKNKPDEYPGKLYFLGIVYIVFGVLDIVVGAAHLYIDEIVQYLKSK